MNWEDFKIKPKGIEYAENKVPGNLSLSRFLQTVENLDHHVVRYFIKVNELQDITAIHKKDIASIERGLVEGKPGSKVRIAKLLNEYLLEYDYMFSTLTSCLVRGAFHFNQGLKRSQAHNEFDNWIWDMKKLYQEIMAGFCELMFLYDKSSWIENRSNPVLYSVASAFLVPKYGKRILSTLDLSEKLAGLRSKELHSVMVDCPQRVLELSLEVPKQTREVASFLFVLDKKCNFFSISPSDFTRSQKELISDFFTMSTNSRTWDNAINFAYFVGCGRETSVHPSDRVAEGYQEAIYRYSELLLPFKH